MDHTEGSASARDGARGKPYSARNARSASNTPREGKTTKRTPHHFKPSTNNDFIFLVENTVDAFSGQEDSAVEDARRILAEIRKQYDDVHNEAERREAELHQLRETIRQTDAATSMNSEEIYRMEEKRQSLEKQLTDTDDKIAEATTQKKVFQHMLERIKKEQTVLKQKLLKMESHLQRKSHEMVEKQQEWRKKHQERVQVQNELEQLDHEVHNERQLCDDALGEMKHAVHSMKASIRRRYDFERWRHEVALEAANEAFNASAGRLRKLWAVEKLAGNCLQKVIYEQVEKSQETEDGFQKIREVTGLTDVMDIVHKFLNRDAEHEQLKNAVKEAEGKLEQLREEFERFRRDTDGMTFDAGSSGRSRAIFQEVEECEHSLNQALKEHAASRDKLQRSTLQLDQMKRWAIRMNRSLASFFDAQLDLEKRSDVPLFFKSLQQTIERFLQQILTSTAQGKSTKRTQHASLQKEYQEQTKLLSDKEFSKANCRVPLTDRPGSAGSGTREAIDYDPGNMASEREKLKIDAGQKITEAQRKQAKDKKSQQRKKG